MEFIRIEKHESGKDVIVAKQKRFILKDKEHRFLCQERECEGYWEWSKLPKIESVYIELSFQLSKWYRHYKETNEQ